MIFLLIAVVSLGFLGQSQPVDRAPLDFLSASVVGGRDGTVYLNGAWRVRAGSFEPERLAKRVGDRLRSDGETIYAYQLGSGRVSVVREEKDGLVLDREVARLPQYEYGLRYAIAPSGCAKVFAARAKFAVLDRKNRRVTGVAADGTDVGVLLDYSSMPRAGEVASVGFLGETGELLLGTGYPERKTHRFAADGKEITDGTWPTADEASVYLTANGRTWAVSSAVREIGASSGRRSAVGEGPLYSFDSIAWTGSGYWLGSTRGAEYYAADGLNRCVRRLGGAGEVTTLALLDGRVFATVGSRICQYWLDDLPDEPMASDDYQLWHFGGYRAGTVTGVAKRKGVLVYGFQPKEGPVETWVFDYRVTDWTHRNDRLHRIDEPPPSNDPSAAVEGHWKVTFDPARKVIRRERPSIQTRLR